MLAVVTAEEEAEPFYVGAEAGCARTAGLARGGRDGAMIGQIGAAEAGGSADSRAIQLLRAY